VLLRAATLGHATTLLDLFRTTTPDITHCWTGEVGARAHLHDVGIVTNATPLPLAH